MNKTLKVILIVFGALIVGTVLLGAGFFAGRFTFNRWMPMHNLGFTRNGQIDNFWGQGMMGNFNGQNSNWAESGCSGSSNYGMGNMMGRFSGNGDCQFHENGSGMMEGYPSQAQTSAEVLTVDQAEKAVQDYLVQYGDPDLELAEVMIFDNQAYAEIIEESTGIGAMEVLVDPGSLAVYPEYGPNMMWNQKYGHMRGGMMGGYARYDGDMTVSADQALETAQAYLDKDSHGIQVGEHADPFYGYYTIHTMKDGEVVGMLSVNGYTAEVFMHTWHGKFVEMVSFEEGEQN